MKQIFILILILSSTIIKAQTINGIVKDEKNNAIAGATVYIKDSSDGANTKIDGSFSFTCLKKDKQTLIISCIGYEEKTIISLISEMKNLIIILKEESKNLEQVTITAGSFTASDNTKAAALSSLDVVTTAGSQGNLVAAFQKLPGTSINGEDGKLFIRGGESRESQTFIDGMRVFNPYTNTANNIPTRARYSPMLFKGMNLSTGAYSAEYGQALSGILSLDTKDMPKKEQTDISILNVALGLGKTIKINENKSLSFNTSYTNLKPYLELFPSKYNWVNPFESFSGEAIYRQKFSKGMLKLYTGMSFSRFELFQDNINYTKPINYKSKESDIYINSTYNGIINDKLLIKTGLAYSFINKNDIASTSISKEKALKEHNIHAKLMFKNIISEQFKINTGIENFTKLYTQNLSISTYTSSLENKLNSELTAIFSEADIAFSENTALRVGLRGEYSSYNKSFSLSPRLALAQRITDNSKISLAYGRFYQESSDEYKINTENLSNEISEQYVFNIEHNSEGRMLRTEIYYKKYDNLIKNMNSSFNNSGHGYAKGIDVFWKDKLSISNFEYMISYSYIDAKRDYLNYPLMSEISFSAKHNLSLVTKYWISSIKSLLGLSYSYNSGRAYNNPNSQHFMGEKTKDYNDISLSWSYLISPQKILFFSVSNLTGFDNIFSYDYAQAKNSNGFFDRKAISPSLNRFFVLGLFITISKDKELNQLENL